MRGGRNINFHGKKSNVLSAIWGIVEKKRSLANTEK